jgi:5'-3' exonuclease
MNTQEKQKKVCDEATLKRLAEMRKKSMETRKMKAELKKTKNENAKGQLKKEYESIVLKKKEPVEQSVNETDEEIYKNANNVNDDTESDAESEVEIPVKKNTRKAKVVSQDAPNYKQEYYRQKLSLLQQQQEQSSFLQSYERLPPKQHLADIAKNQIKKRVDNEVMQRVYKDLFQC